MSKTSLLDLIVNVLPVADLPELVIYFLVGDSCLDHCDTIERVFTTIYRDAYYDTFLDKDCTVRHSFNDRPAFVRQERCIWYRNGKISRENDLPAFETKSCKLWLKNGRFYRKDPTERVGVDWEYDLHLHDYLPLLKSPDNQVSWNFHDDWNWQIENANKYPPHAPMLTHHSRKKY